jgi:hypothetical protein
MFAAHTLTQWDTRDVQSFELEVEGNGGAYRYALSIEHYDERMNCHVSDERLDFRETPEDAWQPLFLMHLGEGTLYRDDHSEGPRVLMDRTRSGVAFVPLRPDNRRLAWFREWLSQVLYIQLNPMDMPARSEGENQFPDQTLSNFTSWYRHLVQEFPQLQGQLLDLLRQVLGPEFAGLSLRGKDIPDLRWLRAEFRGENGKLVWFSFDELSDGQRALIALYVIAVYFREAGTGDIGGVTLCIDEPENYVALAELQPWILEVEEAVENGSSQLLVASHHPEFIDHYAGMDARQLIRSAVGPTRIEPFRVESDDPIRASEYVARGWTDAS